jgi:protein-disulfide isomerase
VKLAHLTRIFTLIIFSFFNLTAIAALPVTSAPTTNTPASFSPAQEAQIQNIVHQYLLSHPEILMQVAQKLQQKQIAETQQKSHQAIQNNIEAIFSTPSNPIAGNTKGNITLVYFFDYQCEHCKNLDPVITQAIQSEPNLRIIFKELPIFGAASEYAARAALAAQLQGKYLPFHNALMKADSPLSNDQIIQIAKSVGLDINKLKSDLNSTAITDQLKNNMKLAESLSLPGTPAIIIAPTPVGNAAPDTKKIFLIPGSTTLSTIKQLILQVQK